MAIVADLMQTYDQSDSAAEVVAEGIHMITPTFTPLQLLLPKIQVASTNPKHIEDDLPALKSALTTSVNSTITTLNLTAGDGTGIFPEDVATYNTIIFVDQEAMLVTANAANTVTVTRGHGSTTAATHTNASEVHVVSQMEHEGADGKKAFSNVRTKPSNYMQTFSRTVEVSGVQEAIVKLGGVTSEVDYQIAAAYKQLALELEKTLIFGVAAAAGDGSSSFRSMAGLWAKISTNSTADSGSVDTTAIETDIRAIWDAGGTPRAIVTTGKLAQDISNLYSDRIRTDVQTAIGGSYVNSIVDVLGGTGPIVIIPHRLLRAGEYYMLDTEKLALEYIRAFLQKPLANDGDADKRWIGGDYTLMLTNEAAHAYRYGFS